MKKILYTLLLVISGSAMSYAQNYSGLEGNVLIFKRNDIKPENVMGSQYLYDKFSNAFVNDGTQYFKIRYNNFTGLMEYEKGPNDLLELTPESNAKIVFADGTTYLYKTYFINKKETSNGYLKVIASSGSVHYYSVDRVIYSPMVKAANNYESDKPAEFKKEKTAYFIEVNDAIVPVSKVKDIQNLFPSKEKDIKEYLKNNKVSLDNPYQMKAFIEFLAK